MPNSSATGGYLAPEATPVVVEDDGLRTFIHDIIVGIVGLGGKLVRPSWSAVAAPLPDVNCAYFGITEQRPDNEPVLTHVDRSTEEEPDLSATVLTRSEEVDVLCVFYGPLCMTNANLLRDGAEIAQNREAMRSAGVALVGFSGTVHAPELINEKWTDRADITMTLRREIRREYPVLHFLGAAGTTKANRGSESITQTWSVDAPEEP